MDLKVNKKSVIKWLDEELKYTPNSARAFETIAKCYLYLEDRDKTKEFYNKAMSSVLELAEEFKKRGDMISYSKRVLDYANYNRIIGNADIMRLKLTEVESIYQELFSGHIKEFPNSHRDFYFEWATVKFHLKKYEEAYEIAKHSNYEDMPISPENFAKGLLFQDRLLIEKSLDELVNFIKSYKRRLDSDALNVTDPWEWYEIGRQILGMPSVLDLFKEE